MTKTPEQLAKEYVEKEQFEYEEASGAYYGFIAGYQAAKELYAAKLKEANDTVAGMADECEGLKSIIYDHDETNLPTPAKWISVKERLPEVGKEILWYHEPGGEFSVGLLHHEIEQPFFTHWMPLPEAPKEEK